MATTISIRARELTDHTLVYDVLLGNVVFYAITAKDAVQLADELAAAIEAHTNEIVTRDYY